MSTPTTANEFLFGRSTRTSSRARGTSGGTPSWSGGPRSSGSASSRCCSSRPSSGRSGRRSGETVVGTGADAVTIFNQNNFNFTGPLILLAAAFFWIYWGVSAKRWFTGPKVQGTREELLAIERELEAAAAGKAAVPAPGVIAPEPG